MKKILLITSSIMLSLSMVLWYGCNDKEKEAESFGSIFGMVSVAGTAEPMRGTGVELYYLNEKGTAGALLLRTTTADDGSYSFDDVKAGEYLLRVEVPGYKRTEYKVVVESGRSARADMQVIKGEGDGETDAYYVIKAANLMVQKEDLGFVTWSTADAMCKASTLANCTDWRLPTEEELMVLYTNSALIGGFNGTDYYWSSNLVKANGHDAAIVINFANGSLNNRYVNEISFVRAVRYINPPTPDYVTLPELNLMVQKEDLGVVDFYSAVGLCEGSITGGYTDWRLPTLKELQGLYVNRSMIGNFRTGNSGAGATLPFYYWSSSIFDTATDTHRIIDFRNGEIESSYARYQYEGYYRFSVRAVRYINPPTPEEPEESGRGYVAIPELNLMVQTTDMSGGVTWGQASVACAQSAVGGYTDWRLPTEEELAGLCARKSEIGGFEQGEEGIYWAETIRDDRNSDFHQLVNFSEGEDCFQGWARNDYLYRVRAVRTITE